jgi:Mg-chelatase subunit ChlD
MNLKIIFIFILIPSVFISASSAESQLQADNLTDSSVVRNTVIVIDASGSTALGDAKTGVTFIGLINANAINIVQNITSDTHVGIVAFSGITAQTDILSMSSEANRQTLISFVKEIGPKGGENPTDLDKGLHAAEKLLNSASCTKEIIVISDGQIHPDGFNQEKNTVIDLKNKGIKMQFVQALTSPETPKEPYPLYNELAQAADGQAIVLNPDERVPKSVFESEEPCSTYIATPTITPTVTTTPMTTPTPIPTPQLEQEVKELKERLNKIEEKQNQSWFESSIDSILGWFKSIL